VGHKTNLDAVKYRKIYLPRGIERILEGHRMIVLSSENRNRDLPIRIRCTNAVFGRNIPCSFSAEESALQFVVRNSYL
jgi:hypothetical protein